MAFRHATHHFTTGGFNGFIQHLALAYRSHLDRGLHRSGLANRNKSWVSRRAITLDAGSGGEHSSLLGLCIHKVASREVERLAL